MDPRNVGEVLEDFKSRRAGIIKALTKDVELFFQSCDPKLPVLCLYGLPSQRWEVNEPRAPPSELPQPQSGINLVRDAMAKAEWLSMVAIHCDSWLNAVASYFSAKYGFDKADRKRLFNSISEFSLISELIMGGTARKRAKSVNASLPDEMVVGVLARLPVKDLLRYRVVCKKWQGLIDNPNLYSDHLASYEGNVVGNHLLVIIARSREKSKHAMVHCSDTFRKVGQVKMLDDMVKCHVLGNVNGLVLVKCTMYWPFKNIILWNPSTNTSVEIHDTVTESLRNAAYFALGLGYDASVNDYKVVAISYPRASLISVLSENSSGAVTPGSVHIYTLRSKSWTTKLDVHPPSQVADGPQVFLQGALHWTSFGPNFVGDFYMHTELSRKDCTHIVSFDVEKETFDYMEMPIINGDMQQPEDKFLTVMDGRLAMFCTNNSDHDIWVMKEYGDPNSWVKCYTFALEYDKFLYFKGNGELLFAVEGSGIKSYDVKKKRVKLLTKTYRKTLKYTIFTHLESLALSKTCI